MTAKNDQKKKKRGKGHFRFQFEFFNAKLLFLMTFWLILIKYSNFLKRNKTEKSFQTSRLRKRPRGWMQVDQKLSELNYVHILISAKLSKFLQFYCKCPANQTLLYYEANQPNIIPNWKCWNPLLQSFETFQYIKLAKFLFLKKYPVGIFF
jgi:hypothetical protein